MSRFPGYGPEMGAHTNTVQECRILSHTKVFIFEAIKCVIKCVAVQKVLQYSKILPLAFINAQILSGNEHFHVESGARYMLRYMRIRQGKCLFVQRLYE